MDTPIPIVLLLGRLQHQLLLLLLGLELLHLPFVPRPVLLLVFGIVVFHDKGFVLLFLLLGCLRLFLPLGRRLPLSSVHLLQDF